MEFVDPRSIVGMGKIYIDDDEEIDIDEIEKSIITGTAVKKNSSMSDLTKNYDAEIEKLSQRFEHQSRDTTRDTTRDAAPKQSINEYPSRDTTRGQSEYPARDATQDSTDDPPGANADFELDAPNTSFEPDDDPPADEPEAQPWSHKNPDDPLLNRMTDEERKQRHIDQVFNHTEPNEGDANLIDQEEEEDEMARILEQIDILKANLNSVGVDISRIPDVSSNSSKKEAKSVLKILRIKNDRLRYCDFFNESILSLAYGLESVFDGKTEILGSKIDLVGWPESVKVKLRRMQYDTSTFVGEIMKGYNIGSGWRILFELLPSLFLYSRERRIKSNDNLVSDEAYKDAILKMK